MPNPKVFLIGFKLESKLTKSSAQRKGQELISRAGCDLVVVNAVHNQKYNGFIVDEKNCVLAQAKTRNQLSQNLIKILKEKI